MLRFYFYRTRRDKKIRHKFIKVACNLKSTQHKPSNNSDSHSHIFNCYPGSYPLPSMIPLNTIYKPSNKIDSYKISSIDFNERRAFTKFIYYNYNI